MTHVIIHRLNRVVLPVAFAVIILLLVLQGNANAEIPSQLPVDVVAAVRDDDLPRALQLLGEAVDSGIITADLVYSNLPSAVAAVSRSLMQLDADQRYDLLEEWTFPDSEGRSIRLLASPVPSSAPPKVFARSIGERPRDTTFAIASVGPVKGCFNSGWMLVEAAEEMGRLSRLQSRVNELAELEVAGAEQLAAISQLVGNRGDLQLAASHLAKIAEHDSDDELTPIDVVEASIAMAALSHEDLRSVSESTLDRLVQRGATGAGISLRPFLRIAHAIAVQVHRGASPPESLWQSNLEHWIPVSVRTAKDIRRGQPVSLWLTHEEHVLHLAGGSTDVLFLRYPLQGPFDFVCETQEGGDIGTDGGLVFGGLHFQATGRNDRLSVWDADGNHPVVRFSPFARFENGPVFNRVSIRSTGEKFQFESNFHPVWSDAVGMKTSPWLGLRSSGTKRPVFRNLRVTGDPTIPQVVDLLNDSELRGWQTGFFAESQPSYAPDESSADEPATAPADWSVKSGELVGRAVVGVESESASLIRYQRPLLEGESVTYEFQTSGGDALVHPAFGRLAFLLEATGVRIRWITTGPTEWTGLEADNVALEPLFRRGPRPLPFKPDNWNRITLRHMNQKLEVLVNESLVYQRPFDHDSQSQFGLYRSNPKTEVRLRNITMQGDWPQKLPDQFRKKPLRNAQ